LPQNCRRQLLLTYVSNTADHGQQLQHPDNMVVRVLRDIVWVVHSFLENREKQEKQEKTM
jgi:hypothetical protein